MKYIMIFIMGMGQLVTHFPIDHTRPIDSTGPQSIIGEYPMDSQEKTAPQQEEGEDIKVEIQGEIFVIETKEVNKQLRFQKDIPENISHYFTKREYTEAIDAEILQLLIQDTSILAKEYSVSDAAVLKVMQLAIWQAQIVEETTLVNMTKLTTEEQQLFLYLQKITKSFEHETMLLTIDDSLATTWIDGNKQIAGPYQIFSTYDQIRLVDTNTTILDNEMNEIGSVMSDQPFYLAIHTMEYHEGKISFVGEKEKQKMVTEVVEGVTYLSTLTENSESVVQTYTSIFPKRYGYLRLQVASSRGIPIQHASVDVINDQQEIVATVQTNVGGITEPVELLVGAYSLMINANSEQYEKRYSDEPLIIKEQETIEQGYKLMEITGTIIIQFQDIESRSLIKSLELYKVEDEKKQFISKYEVTNTEIIISDLPSGHYILKQNQSLQEQRKEVTIPFVIEKTNQSIVLEASKDDFTMLANTGNAVREKLVLSIFIFTAGLVLIMYINRRKKSEI